MAGIPITLTDGAKARVQELTARKDGALGIKLWVAEGKGCGGNEYRMDHMMEAAPGFDKIDAGNGTALYIPLSDSFKMFGMVIDYGEDALGNATFSYSNPNESGRCGCGESFSLDVSKLPQKGI
ncbi:MAG: iron-sulfur cluster assembly accessory protein [Alphaproteobacteria bacterium]|nr:iron-sulfur cluster assembly accessory protein [Alphaproteobacteria bacterium]MBU0858806.1 iron-sulfur cluster assembly accessory protein [Alphaproteobacteria bacterium]